MTNVTTTGAHAQIIPTFAATIGGIPATCCDARALHTFLENGDKFAGWIQARIEKYGFTSGRDFESFSGKTEKPQGGRPTTEYHLSLDMAKMLSMVENNARGHEARNYFLDCEKRALAAVGQVVPTSHTETLLPSEAQTLKELVGKRVGVLSEDKRAAAFAEIYARLQNKFRVNKYHLIARTQLADALAYVMTLELKAGLGAAAPAPEPARVAERITNNDLQNIKRMIWLAVHGFRHDSSWTQAVWFYLRKVLHLPSPAPFTVDQIPAIAIELQRIWGATRQVHDLIADIEQQAAKRILRKGEAADLVLADLRRLADARMAELNTDLQSLPTWMQQDMQAITQRKPAYAYQNLGNEQPGYFGANGQNHS